MEKLELLSDEELLCHGRSLLGSQRQLLAQLVRYLCEVEDRRLHLKAAFSSMFEFCIKNLRLSEGEAFRRLTAARLSRKLPIIFELIESGDIHLSALVLLRDHLTDENHVELLREASGKGKGEVQALLAARFPRPDVASGIRKLPSRKPKAAESEPLLLGPKADSTPGHVPTPAARPVLIPPPIEARIEPLAAARYKVQFTAAEQLKAKLDRARDLLRHANPTGDLALVVERAVDLLLADLENKKLGKAGRPRPARKSRQGEVTRGARREVFARDGERCSFIAVDGRQCEARAWLEVDHFQPRALRGSGESENLRVLCRAHNRLHAEETFGKDHVQNMINLRQRKHRKEESATDVLPAASMEPPAQPPQTAEREASRSNSREQTEAKVFAALCKLGFRKQQVSVVMAELKRREVKPEPELLLRAGLALLTPG